MNETEAENDSVRLKDSIKREITPEFDCKLLLLSKGHMDARWAHRAGRHGECWDPSVMFSVDRITNE